MPYLSSWLFAVPTIFGLAVLGGQSGCDRPESPPHTTPSRAAQRQSDETALTTITPTIQQWRFVPDLPREIAQFETVFWEPLDTESLRKLMRTSSLVKDKRILEIGTGTGLVALCCLQAGAAKVVATDVNPMAVANARYNAMLLGVEDRLEARLVGSNHAAAYAVTGADETFDLIISNPPWENDQPGRIDDFAFYDPGFELLRTLLGGLRSHLKPQGKALLAYGCVTAIRQAERLARENDLTCRRLDERTLDSLPDVFLPGMLLEIVPRARTTD